MRSIFLAAALAISSVAAPAQADAISTGQWYTFGFTGVGSSLMNGSGLVQGVNPASLPAPDAPWTFTLSGPARLIVSDGFSSGDQFSLFDFGALLGSTSAPTGFGSGCGSDITACLANDDISHGVFLLGAGDHSITGTALLSPFGTGAGFFQVVLTAVPEPMSLGLFGAGLAGIGLIRRQRRT